MATIILVRKILRRYLLEKENDFCKKIINTAIPIAASRVR
jgi:hypothetical protein